MKTGRFLPLLLCLVSCGYNVHSDYEVENLGAWRSTTTISLLRETTSPIIEDVVVEGSVISNDSAGNFYAQLIIQQCFAPSSIAIQIGYYDIFAQYAQGEVVAVRLKGLIIKNVDGMLCVGFPPPLTDTVPAPLGAPSLVQQYLRRQGRTDIVEPVVRTIDNLSTDDIGLKVRLDGVFFLTPGIYSGEQQIGQSTSDKTISLYTSPYASFASDVVPSGRLTLCAIVAQHKGRLQLKVNSTDDIKKESNR